MAKRTRQLKLSQYEACESGFHSSVGSRTARCSLGRGVGSTRRRSCTGAWLLVDARLASLQVLWVLLEDRLEHEGDVERTEEDEAGDAGSCMVGEDCCW